MLARRPLHDRRSWRGLTALAAATLLLAACEGTGGPSGSRVTEPSAHAPSFVVSPGQYAHFYFHAHADDWQLFMGDHTPASLSASTQLTFIITDAGDANRDSTFWRTREKAAQTSMDTLIGSAGTWTCANQVINGHPIRRCVRGKVVAYYMRLPDGGMSGEGWSGRGSMLMLENGQQSTITTIDGSTTYSSWTDLWQTMRGIVDFESAAQSAPYVEVNAPEWNRTTNINDHPDHLATGDAIRAAAGTRSWNLTWYIDYQTQYMAINLTNAQHALKVSLFNAYDNTMGAAGYGRNQYETNYQAWEWRTYFRTETSVATPPPAAPTSLSATAASASQINLAWTDNATNESGYYVERAPDNSGTPGTFAQIASLAAGATSYSSTGLTASTGYWYRVRAYGSSGTSNYSNNANATTLAAPVAPSALSATPISSTRIDLAWTDNSSDETGFAVERAPDVSGAPGTFAQIATVAANATSYSNTALTSNTRYWYRVRAVRGTDSSAYTAAVVAMTPVAPLAPTNLAATAVSASQINLTWTDNATNENGYYVERAPDNGGVAGTFAQIASLAAGATSYSDVTGLVNNTRYWYRVRAFTSGDVSAYSNQASATTLPLPPAAPTNLQATASSSSQINLTWTDNANNETGFYVEQAPDVLGAPGTYTQIATLGANVTSYSNGGLNASTRYWYRVRSYNAAAASAYTNDASATTFAPPTEATHFYIHAYQDDWELYMGDRTFTSYQTATKLVFVYTSAGDANLGTAFWQTRERAARAAMDTLIGAAATWACAAQPVNGHSITRCTHDKVVAYFMRLPDGGPSGDGWNGRGSMALLRDGGIASLAAIDGSATYTSWTDLWSTLRGIVDAEAGTSAVTLNSPDWNRTINPSDHPDHYATADAVRALQPTRSWPLTWYIDYQTQNMAVNLTQAQHDLKQRVFYAYDNVMGAAGYGRSQFETSYQNWLWRTYSRNDP